MGGPCIVSGARVLRSVQRLDLRLHPCHRIQRVWQFSPLEPPEHSFLFAVPVFGKERFPEGRKVAGPAAAGSLPLTRKPPGRGAGAPAVVWEDPGAGPGATVGTVIAALLATIRPSAPVPETSLWGPCVAAPEGPCAAVAEGWGSQRRWLCWCPGSPQPGEREAARGFSGARAWGRRSGQVSGGARQPLAQVCSGEDTPGPGHTSLPM